MIKSGGVRMSIKFRWKNYDSFEDIAKDYGVDPDFANELKDAGWKTSNIMEKKKGLLGALIVNNPDKYTDGKIILEGREFSSLDEVVDFYDIPKDVFYSRLFSGWTIYACLGLPELLGSFYNTPFGMIHEGKLYKSHKEVAKLRGVAPPSIIRNLKAGWDADELIGFKDRKINYGSHLKISLEFEGVVYDSINDFKDAFGIKLMDINYRLSKGETLKEIVEKYGSRG